MIVEAVALWRNDHQSLLQEDGDDIALLVLLHGHHFAVAKVRLCQLAVEWSKGVGISFLRIFPDASSVGADEDTLVVGADDGADIHAHSGDVRHLHHVLPLIVGQQAVVRTDKHSCLRLQQACHSTSLYHRCSVGCVLKCASLELLQVHTDEGVIVGGGPQVCALVNQGSVDETVEREGIHLLRQHRVHLHGGGVDHVGIEAVRCHQLMIRLGIVDDGIGGIAVDAVFAFAQEEAVKLSSAGIQHIESVRRTYPIVVVRRFLHTVRVLEELPSFLVFDGVIVEAPAVEDAQRVSTRHPHEPARVDVHTMAVVGLQSMSVGIKSGHLRQALC